jgi:hypothetical protein
MEVVQHDPRPVDETVIAVARKTIDWVADEALATPVKRSARAEATQAQKRMV